MMATDPENWRSVITEVADEKVELDPDNCEVWRFRHDPDNDYFHYWYEQEGTEAYSHTFVFRQRRMMVWLAGVALRGDATALKEITEEIGRPFVELSGGWRVPLHVTDLPTEGEKEFFTQMLLNDLKDTEGVPEEFYE